MMMIRQLNLTIKRVTGNFIWSLSILLIIVGLVVLFVSTPGFSIATLLPLLGSVFLEVGIVTLIIERLSLESLVSVKIPQIIFSHGYLEVISEKELDSLFNDVIRVKLGTTNIHTGDLVRAQDWFLHALVAPAREEYKASIKMLDGPVTEHFADTTSNSPTADPDPTHDLWISLRYEYTTERNLSATATTINGDGVIRRLRDPIPDTTELAKRYRSGKFATDPHKRREEIIAWICNTLGSNVSLFDAVTRTPISTNTSFVDVEIYEDVDEVLWANFSVKCDHLLQPGEQVRVVYTGRWCVDPQDSHQWVSFARTHGFQFTAENFDGFDLLPIASPSRGSQEGGLRIRGGDLIIHTGTVYPDSMFAFAWSKRDS